MTGIHPPCNLIPGDRAKYADRGSGASISQYSCLTPLCTYERCLPPFLFHRLTSFLLPYLCKRNSKIARVNGLQVQKDKTHQPISLNFLCCLTSRLLFFPIFVFQNTLLVLGRLALKQFRWPCQKQPFTNNTTLIFGRTASGDPGRSFLCHSGLKPSSLSKYARRTSGEVCFPLILAMISERLALLKTSATELFPVTRMSGGMKDARGVREELPPHS